MSTKAETFEMAMRFFCYKSVTDTFNLSIEVARALDTSVEIVDISDVSGYYDLSFAFSDGTLASY